MKSINGTMPLCKFSVGFIDTDAAGIFVNTPSAIPLDNLGLSMFQGDHFPDHMKFPEFSSSLHVVKIIDLQ